MLKIYIRPDKTSIMFLFCFILMTLLLCNSVSAQNLCFPVSGSFAANILPPAECANSPVGFCTQGDLTGGLWGSYRFSANQLTPTGETEVPLAHFYSGISDVTTHRGSIFFIDTGALDFVTGNASGLLTVIGGTDHYLGANDFLYIYGSSNPVENTTAGRYEGEVCVISNQL